MSAQRLEFARRLGLNVARARVATGLSQEELGFRAEFHRNAVGALERGESVPGADTLVRIAGALGVEPGALYAGIAWQPGELAPGDFVEGER